MGIILIKLFFIFKKHEKLSSKVPHGISGGYQCQLN